MQNLNRQTANKPKALPLKVMQFGGGNFLRAFVDWMIQELNEKTDFDGGVVMIKPTERGDYKQLKSQHGLFTVVLDGIKNGKLVAEKKVVDCVQKVVNPYSEWEEYLALAENPNLRFIVSNTTEAGIKFNAADKVDDDPPKEFPAKLTQWLHHRFTHFGGDVSKGCILLPCELIEDNGAVLKKTILEYADHWKLEENFKGWLNGSNYFCSTLVDRIVSGYPSDRASEIQTELGFEDEFLVAGEYYHSWVIQGNKIVQDELPFRQTDLNVEFVEDLAPYREMKVRILNGAHTSMVPVGYLAGVRFVKEAMDDQVIGNFVQSLLQEEVAQTLDFPESVKQKYIADVLDRFRNPLLKHRLISISLNSTSKFATRLLPSMRDYYATKGKLPKRIVFGLACLIRFYKGKFNEEHIPLNDDQNVLFFFHEQWSTCVGPENPLEEMVKSILENTTIWGMNLNTFQGLWELVTWYLAAIEIHGVKVVLASLEKDLNLKT